ncbi:hypothetical protein AGABI1DRAFT_77305 [Agaricus bisporus var. burnettii JB137-S8]|uniref:Tim44-like domain-containing protein n=1 Tax=Agaricus bisporus var. burnettii (strain JB137-S8 / ATCC MYA-4627 / FGSC 10392) TaxID=597362 RepID=K5WPN7_AGABU|nr:uncharacterized protein AGABI1DRAFT_77305 [Agaricus bisporus var. burnettii JB137-S8]EKM77316.1 hypothetical protein AGABI1DRAFT_77305 [Agaricus bisporus var. burnettii JB137-S8]
MAARLFLVALPSRPLVWRSYATAAALASKPPVASAPKAEGSSRQNEKQPPQALSMEEEVDNIGRLLTFGNEMPTADVWGQKVDTLDVMIPHNLSSHFRHHGLRGFWSRYWQNRGNDLKNMIGLYALASHNSIPGVATDSDPWYTRWFLWPFYSFTAQSTNKTSWLTTCRRHMLDSYKNLNMAIAKSDIKEIKRRAVDTYQVETLAAHKKKQKSGLAYVWRLHKEVKPAQILSLRVIEGYLSPEEPKFGSRLMVHALVKFDTEQSLEIYDQQCNPLHKPAKGAFKTWDGMLEAEKKRVIQYLVMEKRMWYDGPWLIREQVWKVNNDAKKSK